MNISTDIYPRVLRPLLVLAGLLAYGVFTWQLLGLGHLHVQQDAYLLLLPVWMVGFLVLVVQPFGWAHLDEDTAILVRALWCNIGAIIIAVMVPSLIRLLLLAVPLFGVMYAAIHLVRAQVTLVVLVSALTYCAGVMGLFVFGITSYEFELMSALAFSALMGGVMLLSVELQRMRDDLLERNHGLREAMERLQDIALKDDLTGLHNRRSILELLQRQKALCDRGQQSFTLCYCDLDHFKIVNDRYGHAVGDVALRQFAELARAVVRNVDYVARLGGEEFLLVLVDADQQTALQVAERLADRTREMWVPGTQGDFALTVSVGVATYQAGERVDDVLNRADHGLYEAKRAGRDKVVLS